MSDVMYGPWPYNPILDPSIRRVRDSIRELDSNNWIVADRIHISRSKTQSGQNCWDDEDGHFFSASALTEPNTEGTSSHPFRFLKDSGLRHGTWKIGKAVLKIIWHDQVNETREFTNLQAVKRMAPDLAIPQVLFHGEWDDRSYLIMSEVPGQMITRVWLSMSASQRKAAAARVAQICADLSEYTSDQPTGVDGRRLREPYLYAEEGGKDENTTSAVLANCRKIGMDCSKFHFYHLDLAPSNVLVELGADDSIASIGIIDWEIAGYVPIEWIRNKILTSGGMELVGAGFEEDSEDAQGWRRALNDELADLGFKHCLNGYAKYRGWDWGAISEEESS